MTNIIVALIILFIIGLSASRVIMDKRKGRKCGGCSLGGSCSSNSKQETKVSTQRIDIKVLT